MQIDIRPEPLPKNWANKLMNVIVWGNNEAYYDGPKKRIVEKYEKEINKLNTHYQKLN